MTEIPIESLIAQFAVSFDTLVGLIPSKYYFPIEHDDVSVVSQPLVKIYGQQEKQSAKTGH